jgi:putative tributyrin esterase
MFFCEIGYILRLGAAGGREYNVVILVSMKTTQILRTMLSNLGAAVLFLTGCRETQQPRSDHPRLARGVTLQDVSFFSAALNSQMTYRVFLPANLAPGQKLPVVYLLHGQGDDYRSWSNYSDIARYSALVPRGGLILVMPEGASSYYMNAAGKPRDRYEDYLADDLISDVEARLPAARGRASRAIIGISMGGFAAVKLALSRPELFVFAGALSPAIDVPRRRFTFKRAEQWWRFKTIFGSWGSETRNSSDPFLLVQTASPAATPYFYLSAGEQEPLMEPNLRFAALLRERHFSYEFHSMPGGHDWGEWNGQLPGCF